MAKFTVLLEPQPEGGYSVQCVEVPGAISEGDTIDDALDNIRDAIAMVLEVRRSKAAQRRRKVLRRTVEVRT